MDLPSVTIYLRHDAYDVDLLALQEAVQAALPLCQQRMKSENAPLAWLPEIEASIVNDAQIADVHREFMDDPTATDVITFHHGEIITSAETAERVGKEHGNSLDRELCLYLVHGLMHLGGWDDHEPEEAAQMKQHQEEIVNLVMPLA